MYKIPKERKSKVEEGSVATVEEKWEMIPKGCQISDDHASTTASTMVTLARILGAVHTRWIVRADYWSSSLLFLSCVRQARGDVSADRQIYLVVLPDLTHEITKCLVHVDTLLSRGLNELATKMFGEVAALWQVNIK